MDDVPVDFHVIDISRNAQRTEEIRALLAANRLGMDSDVRYFMLALDNQRLVGCAGLAKNIIKCVAVAPEWRGQNLSARLLQEVEHYALAQGHFHLFLYTRPYNIDKFAQSGFWPIVQCDDSAVLMENTPIGIRRYCKQLRALRKNGARVGAIVMNANPFTLGHRYLAEQAARACDWLHLFVVREDASFFPFNERLAMVRSGVADIPNLTVHEGSHYLISRATFPGYFLKDKSAIEQAWGGMDLLIFRHYIAPALGITHRFVGSEPYCPVTRQYNQSMHSWLEATDTDQTPNITVVEIPRMCRKATGDAISASEVRRLLKNQHFAHIRDIVPHTTYSLLLQQYRAAVA